MSRRTDDVRVGAIRPLVSPETIIDELPADDRVATAIERGRRAVAAILAGDDDRLLVVVGPCSIHDVGAAMEYGRRLKAVADRLAADVFVVMRVYFEKPRTTVGWKGLINDPGIDGSFAVNDGLRRARSLLLDLARLELPAGCEFLDTITPQYVADLVSWGAIGARTTESQVHRELASGLSVPVGFKNGTDGNVQIAIDAVQAARHPHCFLGVTKQGSSAIVATNGNPDCHVILRGAANGPNYQAAPVANVAAALTRAGLPARIMIDCSHGNSGKDPARQPAVARDVGQQISAGSRAIAGVMIESHLVAGRQDPPRPGADGRPLVYGQSITDACLGWDDTVPVLEELAAHVRTAREG
ncbi:MAG: 3-deoxy-7-phosphoheptulonate synthase [Bacteroidota bacterium]